MKPGFTSPNPQLSHLKDEELVILAKLNDYQGAFSELIMRELLARYYPWVNTYVARRLGKRRIGPVDHEDAQQDAVWGILKAITGFDPCQPHCRQYCSFRSFVRVVIRAHLINFLRRHLRLERRYARLSLATDSSHPDASRTHAGGRPVVLAEQREGDPAELAQRREVLTHLREALKDLDHTLRQLWDRLAAGQRLNAIADELRLSRHAIRRRHRRLIRGLRVRLTGLVE